MEASRLAATSVRVVRDAIRAGELPAGLGWGADACRLLPSIDVRGVLAIKADELARALCVDDAPELTPRFNVAPTQPIAVIRTPRRLELLRWGLVAREGHRLPGGGINARVETVARAPVYRSLFRSRQCLVILSVRMAAPEREASAAVPHSAPRPRAPHARRDLGQQRHG